MNYESILKLKEGNNNLILNRLKGRKIKVKSFGFQEFVKTSVALSEFNTNVFFHKVHRKQHFEAMRNQWDAVKKVTMDWISKGYWPGIWTAMDSPHHTYTISEAPIYIIRFYFKSFYYAFDPFCEVHQKFWERWASRNQNKSNVWNKTRDSQGKTLKDKTEWRKWPFHFQFYQDFKIGAVIGYEDFISPVIVNPEGIDRVEFIEISF